MILWLSTLSNSSLTLCSPESRVTGQLKNPDLVLCPVERDICVRVAVEVYSPV